MAVVGGPARRGRRPGSRRPLRGREARRGARARRRRGAVLAVADRREADLVGRVAEVDDDAEAPARGDLPAAGARRGLEEPHPAAALLEVRGERDLAREVDALAALDEAHAVAAGEREGPPLGRPVVAADGDLAALGRLPLVGRDGADRAAALLGAARRQRSGGQQGYGKM